MALFDNFQWLREDDDKVDSLPSTTENPSLREKSPALRKLGDIFKHGETQ